MTSDKEFMLFADYLKSPDHGGWITVASATDPSGDDTRYVFSALASPGSVPHMLKEPGHEVRPTSFGEPNFEKFNGKIVLRPNNLYQDENLRIEPFVFERNFHGARPDTYEVVQDFVLYHDLFFDGSQGAYLDLEGKKIASVSSSDAKVREDALRDYLAARGMVLVLYYQHERRRNMSVAETFGKESVELSKHDQDYVYRLTIGHFSEAGALSTLWGKRIVRPYPEPRHRNYFFRLDSPKRYATYHCMKGGDWVEKSCDVESGRQPGFFLTRVFFEKEVLSKYHNSHVYAVRNKTVCHLDFWSIEFGESGDLIYALLGDLGRIPYEEQIHWKAHNVRREPYLDENFERRQLLGKFADSRSGCDALLELRSKTNEGFERRFGFKLFNDLPPGNEEPHDPASDEEREFDEQVLNMAKTFVDCINKAGLERGMQETSGKSIQVLQEFLTKSECGRAAEIAGAFRMVQGLRSAGAAHLKGQEYQKQLRRFGLENKEPRDRFGAVVAELDKQLQNLGAWLESGRGRRTPPEGA